MSIRRAITGLGVSLGVAGICAFAAGSAAASVSAELSASLTPDRCGASTTVGFSAELGPRSDSEREPFLTGFKLYLPAGMTYGSPTLGLPICPRQTLEASGTSACPRNSRLGVGTVVLGPIPFADPAGTIYASVKTSAFIGSPHERDPSVLIYLDGQQPIYSQLVLGAELLAASGAFSDELDATFPLIPAFEGAPLVATDRITLTLGTNKLTLTKRVHHKLIHYHPHGISVPRSCPHGGFPFRAQFTFQDGENAEAFTTVPCPSREVEEQQRAVEAQEREEHERVVEEAQRKVQMEEREAKRLEANEHKEHERTQVRGSPPACACGPQARRVSGARSATLYD